MRKLNGILSSDSYEPMWVQLNPYTVIGKEPKEFTPQDLFKGEIILDKKGVYIKIIEVGGGALFGKDSYSYLWIRMQRLKHKNDNKNRFYFSIDTHNPKEVYHRTPERPEGRKYGGVSFGGWVNSVEDCIKLFPKRFRKEKTDSMYYSKTLKITKIEKTDLETGKKTEIKPIKKYNEILNSLK